MKVHLTWNLLVHEDKWDCLIWYKSQTVKAISKAEKLAVSQHQGITGINLKLIVAIRDNEIGYTVGLLGHIRTEEYCPEYVNT